MRRVTRRNLVGATASLLALPITARTAPLVSSTAGFVLREDGEQRQLGLVTEVALGPEMLSYAAADTLGSRIALRRRDGALVNALTPFYAARVLFFMPDGHNLTVPRPVSHVKDQKVALGLVNVETGAIDRLIEGPEEALSSAARAVA